MGLAVWCFGGDCGAVVWDPWFLSMDFGLLVDSSTSISVTRSVSWSYSGTGWMVFGLWRGSVDIFIPVVLINSSNGVHSRCLKVKVVLS